MPERRRSRYEALVPSDVRAFAAQAGLSPPDGFAHGPDAAPLMPEGVRRLLAAAARRRREANDG